jgi:CBS domain-containing protein
MICPRCGHDNVPGNDQCASCQLDLAPLDQPAPRDRIQSDLTERPVRALDPRPPVTLPADTPLRQAVQVMLDEGVGAILVVDGDGRLAGVFSERDLLLRVPDADIHDGQAPLSRFMTRNPESVRPDDSLAAALHKMDGGGYRHLPVAVGGHPVGMISVRDMLRHITQLCRE